MKRVGRYLAAASVTLAIAVGFFACSTPFSQGSAGGTDAGTADGTHADAPGTGHADGGVDATGSDAPGVDAPGIDAPGIEGATADAPGSEGSVADAGDAGPCLGAFSAPTLVLAHTAQYYVDSITLTNDELDAFVALLPVAATSEQRKVYAMHRATPADTFTMDTSQPLNLTNVGPTPGAFDVALGADDLTLYFSHRQDSDAGVLGVNIYEALRADAGGAFSASSEFGPGVNDPTTNQFHAHPAGPDLYFTVATLVGGAQGPRSLYVAPLQGGARAALTELNGPDQQANPVPSRDELEIFFASDRAAAGGVNLVYTARRTSAALAFPTPVLVPLAVPGAPVTVTPQHLVADRCRLYLLVNQEDAYVAQRGAVAPGNTTACSGTHARIEKRDRRRPGLRGRIFLLRRPSTSTQKS